MLKAKTVIVLPAHNEEQAIGKVIKDILSVSDYSILVSASGCSDDTVKVAKQSGNGQVSVIEAPKGKGRAIARAFKEVNADHVLMMDSDGSYPAKAIPYMLSQLDYHDAVIGIRKLSKYNLPPMNKWGNEFITRQAQILYGYPIRDLCTGMWAFRGDVVKDMSINSPGFTLEAELFAHVALNGLSLGQVYIDYYPRIGQRKINRLDHLKIMWYLWTRRFN